MAKGKNHLNSKQGNVIEASLGEHNLEGGNKRVLLRKDFFLAHIGLLISLCFLLLFRPG